MMRWWNSPATKWDFLLSWCIGIPLGIMIALMLSGCSTTRPSIPPVQVQRVEVPVPVACINASDVPAEPGLVTLTGDARNDDALLAAKVAALRVWGRQLVGMIEPCTKP